MLDKEGLPTIDLTNNEVAKLHLRHLVGGHSPQAKNEMVFRFEFPEKPGALMKFLETMDTIGTSVYFITVIMALTLVVF
jgi:threonine dehydratase